MEWIKRDKSQNHPPNKTQGKPQGTLLNTDPSPHKGPSGGGAVAHNSADAKATSQVFEPPVQRSTGNDGGKHGKKAPDKTVSLVLGSGGARGLAHIGVIEYLEQQGYEIKAIAGSSMGALVGAMYAMGKLDAYRDWATGLTQADVFSLVDWTFSGGGFIRGQRIIAKLRELAGDANIEDLPLQYTAVTVDIDHGREVWLSDGPVYDAIRASIAIPGLFTPHRYRGRTLVDGGLINPVPVGPTLRTLTDLTVVVNLNGPEVSLQPAPVEPDTVAEQMKSTDNGNGNGVLAKIKDFIDSFASDRSPKASSPGLMAVIMRSLETMESVISRQQLAAFAPDLVINIPRNACMIHEFHRGTEMIDIGLHFTRKAFHDHRVHSQQNHALLHRQPMELSDEN